MSAIVYIEKAFQKFELRSQFAEVERKVLRQQTVAQVSYRSNSLGLMIKFFVSEMENEAGIYLASIGTDLGFRDDGEWLDPWKVRANSSEGDGFDHSPLEALRKMSFPGPPLDVVLLHDLKWFVINLDLIRNLLSRRA